MVEYKGVRLLLQTCYDLRFPVFSRNCGGCYDVAVYVASWPKSRISAWDTLLQARAIENLAYVVAVNRVGTVGKLEYDGHSRVVDYLGRTVTGVADSKEALPWLKSTCRVCALSAANFRHLTMPTVSLSTCDGRCGCNA